MEVGFSANKRQARQRAGNMKYRYDEEADKFSDEDDDPVVRNKRGKGQKKKELDKELKDRPTRKNSRQGYALRGVAKADDIPKGKRAGYRKKDENVIYLFVSSFCLLIFRKVCLVSVIV